MKKMIWVPIIFCLLFLWGCSHQESNKTTEIAQSKLENNTTTSTEASEEKKEADVIESASAKGFVTKKSLESNTPCQLRLIKQQKTDNISSESGFALTIEVDTGDEILKKELDPSVLPLPFEDMLFFGDIDGDGINEILIHLNTGGCGGFGSWQTWVLKIEDNEIHILFRNFDEFDTGFDSRFLEGYRMEVKNRFTGYVSIFDVKESYKAYFDNSQEIPEESIFLDSFYVFEPKDVDNDGICEIICAQYSSIYGHADYTGTAYNVLKFNTESRLFEVFDAWYEPNTEEKHPSE